MGGGEGESIAGSYRRLRRNLDDAGYVESLPLEALSLVQHLFRDLTKTTQSLDKTVKQYVHFKQLAQELETGVGPFKDENVRLIRENSHLRMEAVRLKEDCEEQIRGTSRRLKELQTESSDLKLLIKQFTERVQQMQIESLVKTNKIAQLQERNLEAVILMPEGSKKKLKGTHMQTMELDSCVPEACPYCVRVRNHVEFGMHRDPIAADYLQITDSRIEALQLQIRSLKAAEKDMMSLLACMKTKVEDRDTEIDKLRKYVAIRPGSDNLANGMVSNPDKDLDLQLRSAQMQLDMLQRRNINLEKKLKSSILQEHEDYMMGRTRTAAEREFVKDLGELDMDSYPTHDEMTLLEKLKHLEIQLSSCCKEKAELKSALEDCEKRHKDRSKMNVEAVSSNKTIEKTKSTKSKSTGNFSLLELMSGGGSESDVEQDVLEDDEKQITDKSKMSTATAPSTTTSGKAHLQSKQSISTGKLKSDVSFSQIVADKPVENKNQKKLYSNETKKSGEMNKVQSERKGLPVTSKKRSDNIRPVISTSNRHLTLSSSKTSRHTAFKEFHAEKAREQDTKQKLSPLRTLDRDKGEIRDRKDQKRPKDKSKTSIKAVSSNKKSEISKSTKSKSTENFPVLEIMSGSDSESDIEQDVLEADKKQVTDKSKMRVGTAPSTKASVNAQSKQSKSTGKLKSDVSSSTDDSDEPEEDKNQKTLYSNEKKKSRGMNKAQSERKVLRVTSKKSSDNIRPVTSTSTRNLSPSSSTTSRNSAFKEFDPDETEEQETEHKLSHSRTAYTLDRDKDEMGEELDRKDEKRPKDKSKTSITAVSSNKKLEKTKFLMSKSTGNVSLLENMPGSGSESDIEQEVLDDNKKQVKEKSKIRVGAPRTKAAGKVQSKQSKSTGNVSLLENISGSYSESDIELDVLEDDKKQVKEKSKIRVGTAPSSKAAGKAQSKQSKSTDKLKSDVSSSTDDSDDPVEDKNETTLYSNGKQKYGKINKVQSERKGLPVTSKKSSDNIRPVISTSNRNLSPSRSKTSRNTAFKDIGPDEAEEQETEQKLSNRTKQKLSLRTSSYTLDRDKDEMRVELDWKDEKRNRVELDWKDEKRNRVELDWKEEKRHKDKTKTTVDAVSNNKTIEKTKKSPKSKSTGNVSLLEIMSESGSESDIEQDILEDDKKQVSDKSKMSLRTAPSTTASGIAQSKQFKLTGKLMSDVSFSTNNSDVEDKNPITLYSNEKKKSGEISKVQREREELRATSKKSPDNIRPIISSTSNRNLSPSNSKTSRHTPFKKFYPEETREQDLEQKLSHLRSSVYKLDRDKDEMRVELDRKDEKLARMSQDCEKHMMELYRLQLSLKNAELQIGHTGETSRDNEREMQMLRRQVESLKRDLDQIGKEREEAVKDCRRLAGAVSKEEIEKRSLSSEYDKKSKEADGLRKQVQKYIEEVRRIEDLLLQKEEEMEMLIEHYRSLSLERNNLETQRTSLEVEATSIREDVRDTVDQNITLKNQLASQNALLENYEAEIERLAITISSLQNQLSTSSQSEKTAERDIKATKDLIFTLETKMDKLKLDLANAESTKSKLVAENQEQKSHIGLLEEQLQHEIEKQKQLQDLIANAREQEFQREKTTQDLSVERNQFAERLRSMQSRTETLNEEVSKYRLKSIELQNDLERKKRELQSEKIERESAIAELRRVQEQLNNSSTNMLLNAAFTSASPVSASDLSGRFAGDNPASGKSIPGHQISPAIPFSPMSDTYLDPDSIPLGASTSRGSKEK